MNVRIRFYCVLWITILGAPHLASAQLAPEESLAKIHPAAGLELTLFAAEPDLYNPTTIDIDAQGRVWVCEARNYRLFNQPITDKAGDRIRVLEDTDGDGKCDKATTFYQDLSLQAPMGIAVLGERVYICQSPDLFYLEDTNQDGIADRKTVVLTGFGGVDNDHAIHGVSFGPDGLLYFSNGDRGLDVTDKSGNRVQVGKDMPHQAASVLRCDLEGQQLELLAEGMRNPYEAAVDPWGNVFISDNDDDGNEQCRINFIVDGANYGYWPRRKGDRHLDEVHWNADQPGTMPTMVKTGFGSPTGMLFYQGTLLPAQYQGTLIHADAGPRVIRSYRPEPFGAGYTSKIDVLVSCEEDSWFRPSDVCVAPDGSVFISDWYDPGVGGHSMKDVERGRIYRLAPKGVRYTVPALELDSAQGTMAALNSANQARRYLGFQKAKSGVMRNPETHTALLETQRTLGDISVGPWPAARAFWVLMAREHHGISDGVAVPNCANRDFQVQAVRRLSREGQPMIQMVLDAEIVNNPDPRVRRQLLAALRRYNAEDWAKPYLLDLASQYDGSDRIYREAIGIAMQGQESWAFTELSKRRGGKWDVALANLAVQLHSPEAYVAACAALDDKGLVVGLRNLALDAIDAYGSKSASAGASPSPSGDEAGARIVATLTSDAPAEVKAHALHLLARDEGDVWRGVMEKGALKENLDASLKDAAMRDGAIAFIVDTKFAPMLPGMVSIAADGAAPKADRVNALNAVRVLASQASRGNANDSLAPILTLLSGPDPEIALNAVKALGGFRGDKAMKTLSAVLTGKSGNLDVRREALHALGSSKPGSTLLIGLAEKQELPQEFVLDATEMLHSSPHENIRLMAEKVLPRATTREGQQLPPLSDLLAMQGDPVRGKAVFFSPDRAQCYRCHMINGEGKLVGPDLSKIGQKASKENLFESILNPSAAVAPEYKVWIMTTFAEGAVSGFIRSETPEQIELMDSSGTTIPIAVKDLEERTASSASLMPNGLTAALSAQEFSDLVAFLMTLK